MLTEDAISQFPALQLLQKLGWNYLTPDEALKLRGDKLSNVLLEGVLVAWLRENNRVRFKGKNLPFTEGNILSALQALKQIPFDGLVRTNEKIYDLLVLGRSLQQSVDGDIKSFTIHYVDWEFPENNVFHVTEEFAVERTGSYQTRRPDIVLFVNGIPFGVIECKSPHVKDPLDVAISQHIRNQKEDEIPHLFLYSQLLFALSKNEAKYATTGTASKFWSVWREENIDSVKVAGHRALEELINIPLTEQQTDKLFAENKWLIRDKKESYGILQRQITEQDRALYALCRPERLIELTARFILFDASVKKIARYQQYFCVKKIMDRITTRQYDLESRGGVVWHTQGSGKSLTMVMLAKSLALCPDISDYKIVLVTDRIDLDDQIYRTFHHCGKEVVQAKTGKHLSQLLKGSKQRIVTTIIDKFEAAVSRHAMKNDDPNIFVLVDEGHRGQYGPRHAKMRRVLPNACYIGFTGTPVMKKDKNTVERFGGLIDVYTIDRAVHDKAVVPLLYEGRHVEQHVDSEGIDAWFGRITADLSKDQAADLKKKFSTTDQLNKAEQKVMAIAWDISEHFRDNWQNTGFKGQLVTQDKATALLYKKYLDEFNIVSSEVLISGPDEREGEEDLYQENKLAVQRFWKATMQKYGTEREYNKQLINAFKNAEHPEIIIVVDKLLVGFDAPRNTTLYLTRKLKDHTLLQAIARVNRLCDGKDFGYILDYRGVLENLDHALDLYSTLPEFDAEDIESILTDVSVETVKLPQKHSLLWDTFKEVKNKQDEEEYELLLVNEELRTKFYERLTAFSKTLSIALSSVKFLEETEPSKIKKYQTDLKFFHKLRAAVRRRYAEVVDFTAYEPKIQKLLDTHVGTGEIERITPLVNIFDKDSFAQEVEKLPNAAAKADTIAHRTVRTIHERMQEDPAFYKRFSELLKETIAAFREERLRANEYLKRVTEIMNSVLNRTGDDIPDKLQSYDVAKAYFGSIKETLEHYDEGNNEFHNRLADAALAIDKVIERNRIVNWTNDIDTQNRMKNEIEDLLFELKDQAGIEITFEDMDAIMEQCLDIAKVRRP
ncbi:MAG: restriction endonuclease subunit R [Anaerolineae bacterium SM23_ 63]|nr:MAG: restriction endonuclease subunit R [Anaerolineae bacterium SM23_ 63]